VNRYFVKPDNSGVPQTGDGTGFSLEPFIKLTLAFEWRVGNFQSDDAVEFGIPGAPNRTIRTAAEPFEALKSAQVADLFERGELGELLQPERSTAFGAGHGGARSGHLRDLILTMGATEAAVCRNRYFTEE
jgi:hypothetical protein